MLQIVIYKKINFWEEYTPLGGGVVMTVVLVMVVVVIVIMN